MQQSPETNKECMLPWAALICSVTIHSNGPKTQDLSHQVHSCISPASGLNLISHRTWEKSLDFFGFPFLIYLVKLKYQYKPCLLNSRDGEQATAKTSPRYAAYLREDSHWRRCPDYSMGYSQLLPGVEGA